MLQIFHVWGSGRGERRLSFATDCRNRTESRRLTDPAARPLRCCCCDSHSALAPALAPALATLTLRLSVAVHSAPPGCRVQPGEDSPAAAAAWSRRSRQGQRVRSNACKRQRGKETQVVATLLEGGNDELGCSEKAFSNFCPFSGLVPLHNACSYGHYEVTELLLKVHTHTHRLTQSEGKLATT